MRQRRTHRFVSKLLVATVLASVVGLLPANPLGESTPAAASVEPTVTPQPVGSGGSANLVFADEFDGTALDASRWHTCSWWAPTTCSIETNNELELYTENNVSVANGVLKLQARRENAVAWNGETYNYTSGMVSTGGIAGETPPGFTYRYGYTEARVKIPSGQGIWPAFWALPNDHSWPPEIDVMEIVGNEPNVATMHYHYLDADGAHQGPGGTFVGPDFSQGWHTFGVDWRPDALVWYIDGVERWRFTDASAITDKTSYLLLNLAVGGNWPGSPDASTVFPSDYLVDYVRVWDGFGGVESVSIDTQPPVLSSIKVRKIRPRSATVKWVTDESSDSLVEFWTGTSSHRTVSSSTLSQSHVVKLKGLKRRTKYSYRVRSADAQGNPTVSATRTFRTKRR